MGMKKGRLMSAGNIQWRICSAAYMHHIFGRQCRYVIQSMQYITKTVCHAGKEGLMLKIRLMGTKNSIKWFRKILQKNPKLEVKEFSGLFPNKGTNKFYMAYAEVEKNNIKRKQ